ncbi:RagB/SusD domain-containing protein [Flammeovirgaceae bacterium 311]|nr:RagB/SusD domain-containing protein [Flammeovirgaceae bacterium 311]
MKNYIKNIFMGLAATAVFGCDPKLIDEDPLGLTEQSLFNQDVNYRAALASAYAALYDYYHYGNLSFTSGSNQWAHSTWLLPGDDLTETNGNRRAVELFDDSLNPNNEQMERVWGASYKMIARANVIIDHVRNDDLTTVRGADEIRLMEGEALFLRAYAHWILFNVFGRAVVIEDRFAPGDDMNKPLSEPAVVLDQVIADLEAALPILPDTWASEFSGRATKNSARGLMAKALVFRANHFGSMSDHSAALQVYNEITAQLVPNFVHNFSAYHENNQESLFEIQADNPNLNNLALYNDGAWRGVENMSIYRGFMMQPGTPGWANAGATTRFLLTDKIKNNFGNDPRLMVFINPDDGEEGRIFQKYWLGNVDVADEATGAGVVDVRGGGGSVNNERVLRMADLVLIAAEAYLKTNQPQLAIEELNKIRARTREWAIEYGLSDGTGLEDYDLAVTDEDMIMEWIMNERFVELAGEGQRWWDLKRWHVAGDIDLSGWDGSDEHFSTELSSPVEFDVSTNLLFPIPQVEIDRNRAIMQNNPGY